MRTTTRLTRDTRLAVDQGFGSAIYQWSAFVPQFRFGTPKDRVPAARCRSAFARRVIIESGSPPGFVVLRGGVRRMRVARTRTAPSARAVVHPRMRGRRWWGAAAATASTAAAAATEEEAAFSPPRRRRTTTTGGAAFFVWTSVALRVSLPIYNILLLSAHNKNKI